VSTGARGVTDAERLVIAAARLLVGRRTVFAGHGVPTLAISLAQRLYEPGLEIVYESGVVGPHPDRVPTSISDSLLVTGAECVVGMPQLFGYLIQGSRIDVGFLGAAQIDRQGNLNSTLIGGDYQQPQTRLPGSGGAIEVMAHAREVFVVIRMHSPRSLVSHLDFCTTPSPARAGKQGGSTQASGRGVSTLITPKGTLRWAADRGELILTAVARGTTVDDVVATTGWPLAVAGDIVEDPLPTVEELRILREELDPERIYLR
jgi:glutaconate CoA-transferase subunit B